MRTVDGTARLLTQEIVMSHAVGLVMKLYLIGVHARAPAVNGDTAVVHLMIAISVPGEDRAAASWPCLSRDESCLCRTRSCDDLSTWSLTSVCVRVRVCVCGAASDLLREPVRAAEGAREVYHLRSQGGIEYPHGVGPVQDVGTSVGDTREAFPRLTS
jgi:hypothetical protein